MAAGPADPDTDYNYRMCLTNFKSHWNENGLQDGGGVWLHSPTMGGCEVVSVALTRVFALLGKRWTGLVLGVLIEQPTHFAELRRAIPGISERMLSDRLSELTEAGLVIREVVEGPPLGVRYRVTESGEALRPALEELRRWAEQHLASTPRAARAQER